MPVALITGDKALCDFARELIPAITTVAVNEGRGNGVTSIHPDEAVERIEAAAAKAVQNAAQCKVPMPEHFHIEVDFIKHHVAYSKSFLPRRVAEGRQVRLLRQRRLVRGAALLPLRAQRLSLYSA